MPTARSEARLPYRPSSERGSSSNRRFEATVAYDGTDFDGWQTQPSGKTLQDLIEWRLSSLLGAQVHIAGSGRTDAGVHARGQTFHFDLPEGGGNGRVVPTDADATTAAAVMQRALGGLPENTSLPATVRILAVRPAAPDFHARDDCIGKRYVYTVQEGVGSPFGARFRWALGRDKRLDVTAMAEAAALLVGAHDFSSFGVLQPGDTRTPLKRMRRLEVRRLEADGAAYGGPAAGLEAEGPLVLITAECDRFLMNMMRLVAGTLVAVGLGRLRAADVAALLDARGRSCLARHGGPQAVKAPARGLCLDRCFYAGRDGTDEGWLDGTSDGGASEPAAADEPRPPAADERT